MIPAELFQKVRRIQIRTARRVTDAFAGAYYSAFRGRGMEFEDVREYQVGDDVRNIDWNVTARLQTPHVKSFREERELSVTLVVDISPSLLFGTVSRQKREYIAEMAAVLALSAIKNNDKISLILFTDEVEVYLPPKRGLSHVLRVIRELLVYAPRKRGTDIGVALQYLGRLQRRRGVCFLISDFMAPLAKRELRLTAKRFDLIGLGVTDPREVAFPDLGLLRVRDLESGRDSLVDTSVAAVRDGLAERAEGRLTDACSAIVQAGGRFVDIRTDRDYLASLQRCFHQRGMR